MPDDTPNLADVQSLRAIVGLSAETFIYERDQELTPGIVLCLATIPAYPNYVPGSTDDERQEWNVALTDADVVALAKVVTGAILTARTRHRELEQERARAN